MYTQGAYPRQIQRVLRKGCPSYTATSELSVPALDTYRKPPAALLGGAFVLGIGGMTSPLLIPSREAVPPNAEIGFVTSRLSIVRCFAPVPAA